MFWKIYFVFLVAISFPAYLQQGFPRTWEITDLLISIIATVGLFGYAWKKQFFNRLFWKIFFFLFIGWSVFYEFFLPKLPQYDKLLEKIPFILYIITFLILLGPLFVALYLYAFQGVEKTISHQSAVKSSPAKKSAFIEIELSKKKLFHAHIYSYYAYPFWGKSRLILGPIFVFLGISGLYYPANPNSILAYFFLFFGIFYSLHPFFYILFNLKKIKPLTQRISINNQKIIFQTTEIKSEIVTKDICKLIESHHYLQIGIHFQGKKRYFTIPKSPIKKGNLKQFIEKIEKIIAKNAEC